MGEARARTAPIGDAAAAAGCVTVRQATPSVAADTAVGAVADACPPLDEDAALDAGDDPCARSVTGISDQTSAVTAIEAVTVDDREGVGGEDFETGVVDRITAASTCQILRVLRIFHMC